MKRKLAAILTPAQMLALCLASNRSPICAGHAMAIVELLEFKQWSIPTLALLSGVKRQTISAIIAMKMYPTADKLDRIAIAFDVNLCEFDLLDLLALRCVNSPLWWPILAGGSVGGCLHERNLADGWRWMAPDGAVRLFAGGAPVFARMVPVLAGGVPILARTVPVLAGAERFLARTSVCFVSGGFAPAGNP